MATTTTLFKDLANGPSETKNHLQYQNICLHYICKVAYIHILYAWQDLASRSCPSPMVLYQTRFQQPLGGLHWRIKIFTGMLVIVVKLLSLWRRVEVAKAPTCPPTMAIQFPRRSKSVCPSDDQPVLKFCGDNPRPSSWNCLHIRGFWNFP